MGNRVVDKANLLNYESDDSDEEEGLSDSDEMGKTALQRAKEDLIGVTGRSKKHFYQ
jgi:hypothetical protein